ncbi:MAG: hypothetical protein ACI8V2_004071 [Candidatus Latescibacterota bacterium]|jgi:hypothetical protein
MNGLKNSNAVQFLAKFIIASVILFAIWSPFATIYLKCLGAETNLLFEILGKNVRIENTEDGVHILYPEMYPKSRLNRHVRIPILQTIAIHFNLIVLIALFITTPNLPEHQRILGIVWGIAITSLFHVAQLYFITYIFIWDYVNGQYGQPNVSKLDIHFLQNKVMNEYPYWLQPYIEKLFAYWNHFLREGIPLLIWLNFAHPYISAPAHSSQKPGAIKTKTQS